MSTGPGQVTDLASNITLPLTGLSSFRQQCQDKYADFDYKPGLKYCGPVFDSFLCWGPTPAGSVASQNCPPARLSDTTHVAFRLCGPAGLWLGRRPNESNAIGWTNYTPCFPQEVKTLFDKVDDENAQLKFEIAQRTRYLEIVGFSVSLIALVISLFILCYYRSLRNSRTKIHMSLFTAMILQVVFRLVLYIDQAFIRSTLGDQSTYANATVVGIDNMPYLCEISYALLEYAITEMFLWMFIEGLYLNNLVTSNVLKEHMAYNVYFIVGWSLPLIITIVWAAVTGMHYKNEVVKHCWYGYNFLPIYWIVQGPRLAVVLVNLIFLLNILRVLVIKIRRTDNTELNKVRWSRGSQPSLYAADTCEICTSVQQLDPMAAAARHAISLRRRSKEIHVVKALRAAFVLLPLLGITNALDMTEAPLDGSVWQFALWSYSTHFLRSFQGFFIALLYCFLNAEVRMVMRKHYENYKAMRETRKRQAVLFRTNNGRQSHSMSSPIRRVKTRSESTQTKGQQQKPMRWPRGSGRPRSLADLEISLPTNDESRRSTGTDTGPDLDPSRRSSSASCIGQCIVTVEHEYDNNRALALRDCRYRRSEPSDSFSCQQDAETST